MTNLSPDRSRMRRAAMRATLSGALVLGMPAAFAQHVYQPDLHPVSTIAAQRLAIDTPQGRVEFPLYVSADWNTPQPQVVRAVIVIHGKLRNADVYFRTAQKARAKAGASAADTLLIAPQFLASIDLQVHAQPADLLRWNANAWMGGEDSLGAAPLSSYAVLDAIVARLGERRLFPNLRHIVFAGHSGGAQVVQRYAIAARGVRTLADEDIDVRYLVSSPSTYAYFDAERPDENGRPAPFDASRCPDFDNWKYGMRHRPPYLNERTPAQLEAAYAARRVDYLVGGNDDDPRQAALDKSCPAQAQGPQRLARAQSYYAYLQMRHPSDLNQYFHIVPGVGHNGARMLTSPCALAAMFDTGQCTP